MKDGKVFKYSLMAFWLLALVSSFAALNWYKQLPGPIGVIKNNWPQNVSYDYHRNQYNFVMFAHPKCGCTKASLIELQNLMNETKSKMNVKIFFYHPKKTLSSWTDTDSKISASKIPGIEVYTDEGGEVARRFGAMTSGQVMVYSPTGDLSYSGGITESRGHIGVNDGARSIASVVETGKTNIKTQPTFGCMLFTEDEIAEYKKAGIR